MSRQTLYRPVFYSSRKEGVKISAEEIIPLILDWIKPRSAVDVGCGDGTWLSVVQRLGVVDVLGMDGNWVTDGMLEIEKQRFHARDLTQPIQMDRRFDLVLSVEVAEHLPASVAETFVNSLVGLGPVVVFSAAVPRQGGCFHVNEQWPDYWIELFRKRGYVVIDCFRNRLWHRANVSWWYAQNLLLFVDQDALQNFPELQKMARECAPPISAVHPRMFLEKMELAELSNQSVRNLLGAIPPALGKAMKSRLNRWTHSDSRHQA